MIGKCKKVYDVGLLLRRQFRNFLKCQQFSNNLVEIEFKELKGFLESSFLVEISGEEIAVKGWALATRDMINKMNEGD